jgi:hypothetical protein
VPISPSYSAMVPVLRLYEDVLANDAGDLRLPVMPRMLFVVHGAITVDGRSLTDGEAWHGQGEVTLKPGEAGVTYWRFEFAPASASDGIAAGQGVISELKLSAPLETLPKGDLLLRGDSVAFPPGGCAYLHRHKGPGIRCLLEGGIRIDTQGRSTSYGPGGPWYEAGPDVVFAQAASDRATRFIRVMLLPRELIGKSSIRYINEDDKSRPKSQSYKIFVDAPIGGPNQA